MVDVEIIHAGRVDFVLVKEVQEFLSHLGDLRKEEREKKRVESQGDIPEGAGLGNHAEVVKFPLLTFLVERDGHQLETIEYWGNFLGGDFSGAPVFEDFRPPVFKKGGYLF